MKIKILRMKAMGSGGGSVGRAVASDTRDPQFKSQHLQNFIYQLYIKKEKTKIEKKRLRMVHPLKKNESHGGGGAVGFDPSSLKPVPFVSVYLLQPWSDMRKTLTR